MSDWKPKRFWTSSSVERLKGGFTVLLDGRQVKTPAKADLIMPTEAMANAVALEWDAQDREIDPLTMPVTRSVNAAIDKVTHQHAEVAGLIAAYGETDLICYRAASPKVLAERQAQAWDPLVEWAGDVLSAPLNTVSGVMYVAQDAQSLKALADAVEALDPFELAGFHDLVGLSGSLVMGFAATNGFLPPEELWRRSRIDEEWQIEQWGEDEDATALSNQKREAFLHAFRFYQFTR